MAHDRKFASRNVTATLSTFGTMPDGAPVAAVLLANAGGVAARIIAYGASLQSLVMPDRDGIREDIAAGYDSFAPYLAQRHYLGATIGRVANRIAGGRYMLDGKWYQVLVNNGANSLHGGDTGFDRALWQVVAVTSDDAASVTMRHVSLDGDQGYPGALTVYAIYTLDAQDRLTIDYRASSDAPTVVNLTNHAYWTLAGAGSARGAMETVLTIPADRYTPTNAASIPLGDHAPVADTPFDFRTPRSIGARVGEMGNEQIRFGHGYDHNWVLGDNVTDRPNVMARALDAVSGRGFVLRSNQPGLQFYSGNALDGTVPGKGARTMRPGDAFALEPQVFPNAVNQRGYPSVRLAPGETYRNVIIYEFSTTRR